MKKHILVISQYFHPEPFRINDICCQLVQRGYQVTVLTGIPNYPEGRFYPGYGWFRRRKERWNGMDIIRIPLTPRGKTSAGLVLNYLSFVVSGFFWKLFTKIKADAVFTFEVSPMTQALIGVWYAKRRRIPSVLYVQDLWPDNVQTVTGISNGFILGAIRKMVSYIYKNTGTLLAASPSFAEDIRAYVPEAPQKVHHWPQYAEDFYHPIEKTPVPEITEDGRFKVIFTGNIGQAQGLELLPETAALLRGENVCFVIVGNGRQKDQLRQSIAANHVQDMFCLIDRQPPERIPALLAACDTAFVSFLDDPLFEKTIPAKLQSYLACGMPVIAAAKGETRRIVTEADCGVCCPIGDSEALAQSILRLKNDSLLSLRGQRARIYFEAHFSRNDLMDQLETYL